MRTEALVHVLLLGDTRLPTGAHAYSGGAEQAVAAGLLEDEASLASFLEGRLETGVALEAHAAARACHLLADRRRAATRVDALARLDAELDARMASPSARTSSRRQGANHVATTRRIVPSAALDVLASLRVDPHLCVAVGAAAAGSTLSPTAAAGIAAYQSLAGAASAALRLLGLDPVSVATVLARLAPACEQLASRAGAGAAAVDLPARAAPALDRLLEQHRQRKDRLFAS